MATDHNPPSADCARRFRRKPVEIEAEQWFPGNGARGVRGDNPNAMCGCAVLLGQPDTPHVHTAHGGQRVDLTPGDWIIPEPDGQHFYPCKPDIFAATYEPAASPSADRARVEAVRATLERLAALAPHVAPETSGHDGYRFTLGYDSLADRDAASEAISLVEHQAAALREAATWAPPGDEGLRAAVSELLAAHDDCEPGYVSPDQAGRVYQALAKLRAALAAVSPLPRTGSAE